MILKSFIFLDKLFSWIVGFGYGSNSIANEIRSLKKFIPDGKIFIDVGGNKGLYSLELLKNFEVSEVHIFEPCKLNVEIIEDLFVNRNQIFINNHGLSNIKSDAILYSNFEGSGLASLSKRNLDHFGIPFNNEESITLMRFDHYWNEMGPRNIDLFKIDVEGYELNVLNGIGDYIRLIKIVQFEFGGCNIDTKTYFQDFWYFFKENNFDIYRITPLGPTKVNKYSESLERFQTTNYFCINRDIL